VVQKGRKVKLCIYRTSNGCGWGVKTLEVIKQGSFVTEYVGEVITSDEAEERGKKYGEDRLETFRRKDFFPNAFFRAQLFLSGCVN
jgi:SET domain-containing protein